MWVLNSQTRSPNRPSLKYSSGGSGPLWKWNEAFCLPTNGGGGQFVCDISVCSQGLEGLNLVSEKNMSASDIQKSTNTPSKSMKATSKPIKTTEMQPELFQKNSQTSTSSAADSHVRRLASQVKGVDLRTPEGHFSLISLGFSKSKDPECSYWKMSKDCFLMIADELLKPSSPRLQTWGMVSNGKLLTQRILVSRKTERGCSLSDILETSVDEKYFLSEKSVQKILSNCKAEVKATGSMTQKE